MTEINNGDICPECLVGTIFTPEDSDCFECNHCHKILPADLGFFIEKE